MTELTWDKIRDTLQELAESRGEWGGYPIPIDDFKLVVSPSLPYQKLNGMTTNNPTIDELAETINDFSESEKEKFKLILDQYLENSDRYKIINNWHSYKYGCRIQVIQDTKTGKSSAEIIPYTSGERLTFALNTLGASRAWDVNAEYRALGTLKSLITEHAFHCYMTTNSFLETSKKSNVTYLFRKAKPTIALKSTDEHVKILSVLCLHPIGHYSGTFAGCMVPTDDVIAHLQMMRGDEHKFWSKSNHHDSHDITSGI